MDNIIDIKNANFKLDNSVTNIQYHSYNPYTTAFNQNDEIHIAIQNQDLYVLPHESYIYIEASFESIVTKPGEEATHSLQFANSFISFLFDEIRYEINGFEVDRCKNVGITTLLTVKVKPNVYKAHRGNGWIVLLHQDNLMYASRSTLCLDFVKTIKKL